MIRIDLKKSYCYIVLVLFFYTSDSVYTYLFSESDHLIELITDFLMILVIFFLGKRLIRNIVFPVMLLGIIMCLIQIRNGLWGSDMFYIFAVILRILSVCIFTAWTVQEEIPILAYASKLILCIAGVFLVLYVLFDMGVLGIQPERVLFGNESMLLVRSLKYNFFYYSWSDPRTYFGIAIPSASGFWREPGVTQIFYNFAILYYWFIKPEENKWIYTVILIVAVFSTGSTMGYIVLIGLVAIKFWTKDFKFLIIAVAITAVLGIFALSVLGQRYGNIYQSSRMKNIMTAIDNWKSSPIIGCGYSSKLTSWEGFLNYFVNFGLFGFLPVWIVLKFVLGEKYDIKLKAAFVCWWFLCLMNEACGYSMFFIMLYALIVMTSETSKYSVLKVK